MESRLFRLVTIGDEAADNVDKAIGRAAVTRMFNLRDVLELVNHRLHDRTLAGEQLVSQSHQVVLHIAPGFGKELNIKGFEQLLCQLRADVASVGKDFATQAAEQVYDGFAIVCIARCNRDIQ